MTRGLTQGIHHKEFTRLICPEAVVGLDLQSRWGCPSVSEAGARSPRDQQSGRKDGCQWDGQAELALSWTPGAGLKPECLRTKSQHPGLGCWEGPAGAGRGRLRPSPNQHQAQGQRRREGLAGSTRGLHSLLRSDAVETART